MENKIKNLPFLILFLFFSILPLYAQEQDKNSNTNTSEKNVPQEESASFVMEDAEGNSQLIQKFMWDEVEYVLKYNFTIEKLNEDKKLKLLNEYEFVDSIDTEKNYVELMLSPGTYRYKIEIFNLLGISAYVTDWMPVEILQAYQPKVTDISPSTIYLEEVQDGIFTISGSELRDDTEFYFQSSIDFIKIKAEIIDTDRNYRRVKIKVNPKELDSVQYTLVARNPSGLQSKDNVISVKFKKPFDLDISGGFLCPVILFDETLPKYLDSRTFPISAAAKLSVIPFKHNFGYFGIGIEGTYTRMFKDFDSYKIDGNMINGYLNFIYQIPIRKKLENNQTKHIITIEFHGGPGITFLNDFQFHFDNNIESEKLNSLNFGFDAGFAVAVYLTNRLFIEANVDYIMAFMSDMTMGTILPSASVGWQF